MKSELAALYQLQQLDSTLDRMKKEFAALDQGQTEKATYDAAKAALDAVSGDIHTNSANLRDTELEQQTVTTKKTEYEKKLYSGKVTNAKELMAMQEEIEMLDRQRGRLEEKILGLHEALEARRIEENTAKKAMDVAKKALKTRQTEYKQVAEGIAEQAKVLVGQRPSMVKQIPETLMKRYDSLRASKAGLAIVALEDGNACGGCKMGLPSMLVQLVHEGNTIQVCQNCKRILCEAPKKPAVTA